jgi:hypothetical protein
MTLAWSGARRQADAVPTIGDRLSTSRAKRFVGRQGELELFAAALEAPDPPFSVLFVHGPGGVGKTALLDAFVRTAVDQGVSTARIDARSIDLSPNGVLHALATTLAVTVEDLDETLGGERHVLILDTYEQAGSLDEWLRERFVVGLPDHTLVVLAGRTAPSARWRSDPGWRDLLRVVSLRNLSSAEARDLLAQEGVTGDLGERVAAITHGHPLALALCIELLGRGRQLAAGIEAEPDVVSTLLECFLDDVPSPEHRLALGLAARVRFTDEPILRTVVGDRAAEMFAWLRNLSFMEQGELGLFPHDLAREVIDSDLRWRDRARFEDVHMRARAHILRRAGESGRAGERGVSDLMFLHRANPVMASHLDYDLLGRTWSERVTPSDHATVLDLLAQHQGDEQAALAERWLGVQPEGFGLIRSAERDLVGVAAVLHLHKADLADIEADPGAAAAWSHACRHDPPRSNEAVTEVRFMVDAEMGQAVPSATFTAVAELQTRRMLGMAHHAWDYLAAMSDVASVEAIFNYIFYDRVPEASYEVGGRHYHVFAHDWRRMDLEAWLDATRSQELSDVAPPPRVAGAPTAVVLSQVDFAGAVRTALRDLHQPDRLAANPLLRSRVVRDRAGDQPTPADLEAVVLEAVESVGADPRADKAARALDRTFVRPASSQERAAELLDLPFSTYRRHLTRGVDRVVAWLWQRELYGPD